jgi:hypothetical protein
MGSLLVLFIGFIQETKVYYFTEKKSPEKISMSGQSEAEFGQDL